MKKVKLSTVALLVLILIFAFSGCQEDSIGPEAPVSQSGINKKTTGDRKPDDLVSPNHEDFVAYPTIIKKTFIPTYEPWADKKCLTWRIEWPAYDASVDTDKIATVFSLNNGALNSFDFLNSVAPSNTHNAHFSLHFESTLKNVNAMWMQLDHYLGATETTRFADVDFSVETIESWVKNRPAHFESHWPGAGQPTEIEYEEGDIILFHNVDQNLYGGIRIVSMTPRIIEVYLAVPN